MSDIAYPVGGHHVSLRVRLPPWWYCRVKFLYFAAGSQNAYDEDAYDEDAYDKKTLLRPLTTFLPLFDGRARPASRLARTMLEALTKP
jgi:hypothetical protein